MTKRRRTRRPAHLPPNTYIDERTGIYMWRRRDPITKRRGKRSTGTPVLEEALRMIVKFEEEHRQRKLGIEVVSGWGKVLLPLAEEWLAFQKREGTAGEGTLKGKRREVLRALEQLRLVRAADLTAVAALHERLMALQLPRVTARRAYQEPLKQFSAWLAGNNRHLERDPLAAWEPIHYERGGTREPRAFEPEEVARAFLAADRLDVIHGREHPTRPVLLGLLILAPRISALIERDVGHFFPDEPRVELGEDVGNKRRGAGALDARTAEDLRRYVGDRKAGPLFLAARGDGRISRERLLDTWREAFSLGVVTALWPAAIGAALPAGMSVGELQHLVNLALIHGRVKGVSKGGNPKHVNATLLAARQALEERVQALADELRDAWADRMLGVHVHGFRTTHRTWAVAVGVPELVVDKQLGHAAGTTDSIGIDLIRSIKGSETGRKHYLDMRSRLLDAASSATAVRALLDEALAAVARAGSPAAGEDPAAIRGA